MSILINMEMPKNCYECPMIMSVFVFKGDSDICSITEGGCTYDSRPPHCPLISIPPHGRLIDVDALPMGRVEWEDIVNAPTIIEAEVDG